MTWPRRARSSFGHSFRNAPLAGWEDVLNWLLFLLLALVGRTWGRNGSVVWCLDAEYSPCSDDLILRGNGSMRILALVGVGALALSRPRRWQGPVMAVGCKPIVCIS